MFLSFRELEQLLKRFSFDTRGSGDIFTGLTNQSPRNPPDCLDPDHQEHIPDPDQILLERFPFLICLHRVSSGSSLTRANLEKNNKNILNSVSSHIFVVKILPVKCF